MRRYYIWYILELRKYPAYYNYQELNEAKGNVARFLPNSHLLSQVDFSITHITQEQFEGMNKTKSNRTMLSVAIVITLGFALGCGHGGGSGEAGNRIPIAYDSFESTLEDTPLDIELKASDDDNDELTYYILEQPENGALEQIGIKNWKYIPNPNYFGSDSFKFHVNDGTGNSSVASIYIEVEPLNDVPAVYGRWFNMDDKLSIDIELQASDIENDTLSYHIDRHPQHGFLLQIDESCWRYTRDADYLDWDTFTFHVNDGRDDSCTTVIAIKEEADNFLLTKSGSILLVRPDAPEGGDGTCWSSAFNHPQDAVNEAPYGVHVYIWVAAGTYNKNDDTDTVLLRMGNRMGIYGGFNGIDYSMEDRDYEENLTILDGDMEVNHVVEGASLVRLDGFTIINGLAQLNGGGMYISLNTNITIQNCTFSDNSAGGQGGGIYSSYNSNIVVQNCTFSDNSAGDNGGGLNNAHNPNIAVQNCEFLRNSSGDSGGGLRNFSNANIVVQNCTFSDNSANDNGGGLSNSHNINLIVQNCELSRNSSGDSGGGLRNFSNANIVVQNCTFSDNSANYQGGGMYSSHNTNNILQNCIFTENSADSGGGLYNRLDGNFMVQGCVFSGNSSEDSGGGMYNSETIMSVVTENCIFTGNSADFQGGGLYNFYNNNHVLTNCTFSNNSADSGGGIFSYFSDITMKNCILWADSASANPEIYNDSTAFSVSYSCIEQDTYAGSDGNISLDPFFVSGPNGDYYLDQINSPCVDAGDPNTNQAILDNLSNRTTSNNGSDDIGVVDMGYHYLQERP